MLVYVLVCMANLMFLLVGYTLGSDNLENKTGNVFSSLKNKFNQEEYEAVEIE